VAWLKLRGGFGKVWGRGWGVGGGGGAVLWGYFSKNAQGLRGDMGAGNGRTKMTSAQGRRQRWQE